jgi:hypothetical protein
MKSASSAEQKTLLEERKREKKSFFFSFLFWFSQGAFKKEQKAKLCSLSSKKILKKTS